MAKDPRDGLPCGICCFKEDLIWAYNKFMEDCGMNQMVDENGSWLGKLYDDYNIAIRQPRANNSKRKRVLFGIDLSPEWRIKLFEEFGLRDSVPSAEPLEEWLKNEDHAWLKKYYHPKKGKQS
jgi:hypothetical protein